MRRSWASPRALGPARTRLLVWIVVAVAYIALGSLYPFVLLLGWWEAIPAVLVAIVVGDALARRATATESDR